MQRKVAKDLDGDGECLSLECSQPTDTQSRAFSAHRCHDCAIAGVISREEAISADRFDMDGDGSD